MRSSIRLESSGDEVAGEHAMGVEAEHAASDLEEEEDEDDEDGADDDKEVEARRGGQAGILGEGEHARKQGNDEGGVCAARREAAGADTDVEGDAHEAGYETGGQAAGGLHRGGKLVGDFVEEGQQLVFVGMFVAAPPSDPLVRSVCRTPKPQPQTINPETTTLNHKPRNHHPNQ